MPNLLEIPHGWTKQRLCDLLSDEFAGVWGQDPVVRPPNAFALRSTNLGNHGSVDYSTAAPRLLTDREVRQKQLQRGDLMLEASGGGPGKPVGRVAEFEPSDDRVYIVSNFFRLLRPRHDIHPGFLSRVLQWLYLQPAIWQFQQQTTGIINLKIADYYCQAVALPSLAEQRRIAEILDSVDESIRTTGRLITKLLISKQGMAYDLLINRSNSSWQTTRLGDVCLVESGQTPSRSVPRFWKDGTIPWVKTGEINFSPIDRTEEHISSLAVAALGMKVHAPQTILIAMYGQGATRGRVGILRIPATTNQACAALTCTSDSLLPEFLYEYISAHYEVLRKLGHGSQQTNLSTGILASHQIAIPNLSEQESILRQIAQHVNQVTVQKAELAKLQLLKRGLMDDLLTGRVRVNTGEGVAA